MYNQMYKKYLIKNDFWMTKSNSDRHECWFVKHTPEYGGIYAKLLQKGVEIQFNSEKKVFTNFNELDNFLDKINVGPVQNGAVQNDFYSILNRKSNTKVLRALPL
ncbi:MAG: hypothetical protein GY870_10405 [archaeon]|nr:hypothetical protein [archaeon]